MNDVKKLEGEVIYAPLFDDKLNAVALVALPGAITYEISQLPANWLRLNLLDGSIVVLELGKISKEHTTATVFTIDRPEKAIPNQLVGWEVMSEEQRAMLVAGIPVALADVCRRLAH